MSQLNEIYITDTAGNVPDIDLLVALASEVNEIVSDNIVPNEAAHVDPLIKAIQSEAGAGKTYAQILEAVAKTIGREITLDDVISSRKFHVNSGHLTGYDFNWGHNRDIIDDVVVISRRYPDYVFTVVRTWPVTSHNGIEKLENYWKGEFQQGVLQESYTAEPIQWKSETEQNWYL